MRPGTLDAPPRPAAGPAGAPPHSGGTAVAANVALATVLTAVPVFLPGAAGRLITTDLGWGTGRLGWVLAVYWVGSLLGAALSRRMEAPRAVTRTVGGAVLAAGLGLAWVALAPRAGLWGGTALGGLAYGFSQPHSNVLLMRRCSARTRGLAFGVKQAAVPMATLLSSLAVPAVAVSCGWRAVFAAAALGCLLHGGALVLLGDRGRVPAPEARPRDVSRPRPLRLDRRLAGLTAAGLCGGMLGNSLGGFLILSLTGGGLSLTAAGAVAAVGAGVNIAVRIGSGAWADRRAGSPRPLLGAMFAVGALGAALLAVGRPAAAVPGAVLAYAGGWGWAGLLHYAAAVAYPGRENRATAWTQMGVSCGSALGPVCFGLLYQFVRTEAWWPMAMVACCGWLALRCSAGRDGP